MKLFAGKWLQLIIVLSAPLLSVIDVFIINIALPAIKDGLQASNAELQLVIAGYLLGYAAFLITGGRAGDIYGRKKIFMAGMLFFTLTSCLCGLAQSTLQLNVSRFFQGISAAFMVPQTISYIQVLFPEQKERTKAVGLFGVTLGIASISGQFLGGYFSSGHFFVEGWRLIFFINLPVGILSLLSAAKYLQETARGHKDRFDYSGTIILTAALACLIYPLIMGPENGWSFLMIALLLASFIGFAYFIKHQKNKLKQNISPLINMDLFRYKDFNLALLATLFFFMMHTSYLLVSTFYFQNGMRIPPFQAGLNFAFLGLGFLISSVASIKLVMLYGKKALQAGVLIMLAALFIQFNLFTFHPSNQRIIAVLILYGLGLGLVLPSLLTMALKSIPAHFAGAASGVYSTFQQTASALGVSIIGGIFFYFQTHFSIESAFRSCIIAEGICLLAVSWLLYRLPDSRTANAAILILE